MTAQRTLDVGDVDIEGIELIPAQPQPLSGRVVAPEGRRLPPGLIVVLESRESGDRQGGGLAQVAADGTFSIPQVAPGDYNPILGSSASGYDDAYIQAIRSGDSDALAEGVHIGTSPTPALEIVLKANGAAAEGTVTDDKGDPVPNASILLVPDPPKQGRSALFGQCQTGADGTCKIFGITPGEYHAYAFPAGGEIDRRDPEALKPFESYGQAIQFAEGEQKVVSLKTPPDE